MKAAEIQNLELLWQQFKQVKKKIHQDLQELSEGIEKLLPEEPLHVDRDYSAELDEIYKEKCRGKS